MPQRWLHARKMAGYANKIGALRNRSIILQSTVLTCGQSWLSTAVLCVLAYIDSSSLNLRVCVCVCVQTKASQHELYLASVLSYA